MDLLESVLGGGCQVKRIRGSEMDICGQTFINADEPIHYDG